jgi:hypothetical protein
MAEGSYSVLSPSGYSKSPYGSFAGRSAGVSLIFPRNVGDLGQVDKGLPYQSVNVWLGPTLGLVSEYVRPEFVYPNTQITIGPKDSVALVNTSLASSPFALIRGGSAIVDGLGESVVELPTSSGPTVFLPDVVAWAREPFYSLYTPFERAIWIKDIGGNAVMNNITIVPFGTQMIDGATSYTIATNFGIARFYPLNNLQGWYVG